MNYSFLPKVIPYRSIEGPESSTQLYDASCLRALYLNSYFVNELVDDDLFPTHAYTIGFGIEPMINDLAPLLTLTTL
jgi:hypothetical protein